ncbi:MAG: cupin domain-containing protein [Rhodospirillaceae bacterium]
MEHIRLGAAGDQGDAAQAIVPAGCWQAAAPASGGGAGWSLMGCIVAPAFDFAGFEMAPVGWSPSDRPRN